MPLVQALVLVLGLQTPAPITLVIRVFDGAEDVTAESRINIFKAGDRQAAVAESRARRVVETSVAQGMYAMHADHPRARGARAQHSLG